jgi:putative ABC transport system ATP-binding protein
MKERSEMSMEKPTLRARQLLKAFGEGDETTVALRDVMLELHPGQIALLMGPSGSGKSTLLAVLSGLMRPDRGEVIALEKNVWAMSDQEREQFRLRHCGFIFQGYNLFPALTARQQIEIVLRWGEGVTRREARRRTDELLEQLGLAKQAEKRPAQLSGGEKQRVAIGRALVKNPDFCFADEPTSALDWSHGEQVVEMLRNAAHERSATILIVSHDVRMLPLVDHVFHMEDGVVTEAESPAAGELVREFNGRQHGEVSQSLPSFP